MTIDFYQDAIDGYVRWKAVEKEIALHGQSSSIGGKSYTLADIEKVRSMVSYYRAEIEKARIGYNGRKAFTGINFK